MYKKFILIIAILIFSSCGESENIYVKKEKEINDINIINGIAIDGILINSKIEFNNVTTISDTFGNWQLNYRYKENDNNIIKVSGGIDSYTGEKFENSMIYIYDKNNTNKIIISPMSSIISSLIIENNKTKEEVFNNISKIMNVEQKNLLKNPIDFIKSQNIKEKEEGVNLLINGLLIQKIADVYSNIVSIENKDLMFNTIFNLLSNELFNNNNISNIILNINDFHDKIIKKIEEKDSNIKEKLINMKYIMKYIYNNINDINKITITDEEIIKNKEKSIEIIIKLFKNKVKEFQIIDFNNYDIIKNDIDNINKSIILNGGINIISKDIDLNTNINEYINTKFKEINILKDVEDYNNLKNIGFTDNLIKLIEEERLKKNDNINNNEYLEILNNMILNYPMEDGSYEIDNIIDVVNLRLNHINNIDLNYYFTINEKKEILLEYKTIDKYKNLNIEIPKGFYSIILEYSNDNLSNKIEIGDIQLNKNYSDISIINNISNFNMPAKIVINNSSNFTKKYNIPIRSLLDDKIVDSNISITIVNELYKDNLENNLEIGDVESNVEKILKDEDIEQIWNVNTSNDSNGSYSLSILTNEYKNNLNYLNVKLLDKDKIDIIEDMNNTSENGDIYIKDIYLENNSNYLLKIIPDMFRPNILGNYKIKLKKN